MKEVSKLIYNALLRYHAIYLPEVGTLSVVRHASTISSLNEVLPPRYDIEFSSDDRAKSLVTIISDNAGVDAAQAQEIYLRWLDKVREGSVIKIDRVGTLTDKSFAVDRTLFKSLNLRDEPLRISRRRSFTPIYIVLFLAVICGGGWWCLNLEKEITSEGITVETIVVEDVETPLVDIDQESVAEEIEEIEVISDWRSRGDIRHWVVVGSYSTTQNAERAIADIVMRMPEAQCDYFKLGSMFAVAVFGSSDAEECQKFKNQYSKEFAQSWVYTPKKFR